MAGKKITNLTSGSLSTLPISGVTVVSYSGSTFQHPLNHLRNILVDSGSHYFTGSQYISGNLELTESVSASYFVGDGSQLINLPDNNIDTSSLATTGSNIFNDNQIISGTLFFGNKGSIESILSGSGDGSENSILKLNPDISVGDDQYLIIDPIYGNEIHLRAGGVIDQSTSRIVFGGLKNNLSISDADSSLRLNGQNIKDINSYYFEPNNGYSTASWVSDEFGNNFIIFNDPTMDVYNAIWAFNEPSTIGVSYNNGNDFSYLTVNGFSTPGFPAAPSLYIIETPPQNPTLIEYVTIEIKQYGNSYIEMYNGNMRLESAYDIRLESLDDFRIYSNDNLRIINNSETQPIELILDDNNTSSTFAFNVNGSITFPNGEIQSGAYTGFPENIISSSVQILENGFVTTGSNTFNGDQTINGSLNIKGVSETIDVNGGFGGDKTFNYTSGSIFFITGLTNNGVWNVNDVPLTNNNSTTITFVIKQESTPYSGSEYRINDSNISIQWPNGEIPTGSANKTDVIGLTLFRIGDGWDSIGSISSFG